MAAGLVGVPQVASALESPTLIQGTLESATGPLANAVLEVYADQEPNPDSTPVTYQALAVARTDANGQYAISVTPTAALLAAAAVDDGVVNFSLTVTSTNGATALSFSRRWTGVAWSGVHGSSLTASPRLRLSKGNNPAQYDTRVRSLLTRPALAIEDIVETVTTVSTEGHWTRYADVHSYYDMKITVQYGTTADSDIDVAYNSGSGWYLSGTAHVGNTSGGTAQQDELSNNHHRYYVHLNYAEDVICGKYVCTYRIRAYRWNGGLASGADVTNSHDGCVNTPYQSHFYRKTDGWVAHRYSYRNVRYGFAATAFGVQVGGTSGYSTNADLYFYAGLAGGGTNYDFYLCGVHDYWPYDNIVYTYSN
jgi:hypothetical protein